MGDVFIFTSRCIDSCALIPRSASSEGTLKSSCDLLEAAEQKLIKAFPLSLGIAKTFSPEMIRRRKVPLPQKARTN